MKPLLHKALAVAVIGAGVIAGPIAALAQSAASEGPRASSQGNWTGTTGDVYRPYNSVDDPVFEGPRPSSAH